MEDRIKTYENFISKAAKNPGKYGFTRKELHENYIETLRNFQHERLIHLLVTFFFAILALISIALSVLAVTSWTNDPFIFTPLYALTIILTVLTAAYIKHYYFLETHIQKLYDIEI